MKGFVHLEIAILFPIAIIACNAVSTISGSAPLKIVTGPQIAKNVSVTTPSQSAVVQNPPTGHLYHGIYPGQLTGQESGVTLNDLQAYEELAGKKAAWVYFSNEWFEGREFPLSTVSWIRDYDSIPFIRLMLRSSSEQNKAEPVFTPQSIADGKFDSDIHAWCQSARDFDYPLLVEYGTEMNGQWFPWNGVWHGGEERGKYGDPDVPDGPERFRDAYRHIIQICRDEGADNITWVFHVNADDNPGEDWNALENYYPGDEWIDWIAISLYGAQTPMDEGCEEFRIGMDSVYPRIENMARNKPVIIAEFGVTSNNPHVDQAQWAHNALSDITSLRWPRVIGFSWWNEGWQNDDDPAHDTNMRLQENPQLAEVFQDLVGSNPAVLEAIPTTTNADEAGSAIDCNGTEPRPITDKEIRQPAEMKIPEVRVPFRDPVLGTCLIRVTDSVGDFPEYGALPGLKNEYSRVQSYNADETLLLVLGLDSTWYCYDAHTFNPLAKLPIEGPVEPRWSSDDPETLFYSDGVQLMSYNILTKETKVIHDFSTDFSGGNFSAVWTRYEGSPSFDGNTWGFMAEDENWLTDEYLIYDLPSDRVIARLSTRSWPDEAREIDSVTISPLGNYFLAYMDKYCETGQSGTMANPCGLMVYDRNLKNGRGLLRIIGHSDMALDSEGHEVLVFQDIDNDSISMLDLTSGSVVPLLPIDFSHTAVGLHFSGRASKMNGWVLVSTHDGDPATYTWMDDKIFAVELKPEGRVVQLAFTHSLIDENVEHDYWAEPQATVNRDFSRILFTSNWGQSGDGAVNMYAILLEPGWIESAP